MTISELGSVGEVIGAAATVATLLYLALQIRANTKQTKLTNWGVLAERYMSVYAQSSNFELADVIVRGRNYFNSLNDAENLAFGHYMENICIANEGALVMADSFTRRDEGMVSLFNRHVSWHMDCEGARDWFEKFSVERGFPEDLNQAIIQALHSKKSLQ